MKGTWKLDSQVGEKIIAAQVNLTLQFSDGYMLLVTENQAVILSLLYKALGKEACLIF